MSMTESTAVWVLGTLGAGIIWAVRVEAKGQWHERDITRLHGELEQFRSARGKAEEAFKRFVAEGRRSGYDPWKAVQGQIYLCSNAFRSAVLRRRGTPVRYRRPEQVSPASSRQVLGNPSRCVP